MSPVDVLVIATICALFVYLWDRELRRADFEHEMRMQAEAECAAFESLFLEDAQERTR